MASFRPQHSRAASSCQGCGFLALALACLFLAFYLSLARMLSELAQDELLSLSYIYPDLYHMLTESSFQIQLSHRDHSLKVDICIPPGYPTKERPTFTIRDLSSHLSRSYLGLWTAELEGWLGRHWTPSQPILYDMICQLQEKLDGLHRRNSQGCDASPPEPIVCHERGTSHSPLQPSATEPFKTLVTRESFLAWRAAFEQESRERKERMQDSQAPENGLKPTGRQLFEADRSLMLKEEASESDSENERADEAEAEAEGQGHAGAIEVDASLFSRLDEIDEESV